MDAAKFPLIAKAIQEVAAVVGAPVLPQEVLEGISTMPEFNRAYKNYSNQFPLHKRWEMDSVGNIKYRMGADLVLDVWSNGRFHILLGHSSMRAAFELIFNGEELLFTHTLQFQILHDEPSRIDLILRIMDRSPTLKPFWDELVQLNELLVAFFHFRERRRDPAMPSYRFLGQIAEYNHKVLAMQRGSSPVAT